MYPANPFHVPDHARKDEQYQNTPVAPDKRKQPGYWLGKTENEGGKEQ